MKSIFATVYMREGFVLDHTSSGHWELCASHYIIIIHVTTSHMTYILSHRNPTGGCLPCYRNALSGTWDVDGLVRSGRSARMSTNLF